MKINAVGVTTSNFLKTIQFYEILGFKFPDRKKDEGHLESIPVDGSAKLMIDTQAIVKNILGENPKPGNHSVFAIEYKSPLEIDEVVNNLHSLDFKIVKEPCDAFWGQRYSVVEDPDGYKVDLYCPL